MVPIVNPGLEAYARKHTETEGELFRELASVTREETTSPQMQVGHLEGAFLRLLIKITGARRALEIGTFTGYSALAMAEGLPEDGSLITCDVDADTTAIAKRFWAKSPHGRKIESKLGPALETLRSLEGPFDFVFIDADKENYSNYWKECVPKVRKGGVIAVDNVLWSGRVLDPKDERDRAICDFNKLVFEDGRVEPVILTVRDGISLSCKL